MSIPHSLHCAPQTLRDFRDYRRHAPFTGYDESKYKYNFFASRRLTDEKRPSHADSSGRECLKKNNEQFTSSASFSTFRSFLGHSGNHESDDYASGSAGRSNTMQKTRCVDQKEMNKQYLDHWILRNFASDTDFLKNWYEANLKQWKETHDLRYSIKISKSGSQTLNTKDRQGCRQSGCERICRKLRRYNGARISRYSDPYEGRMDEHERRVTQVTGFEAREAPRGQRSFLLHDNLVFLRAGERRGASRQRKQIHVQGKTVNTCPKLIDDWKVGPEASNLAKTLVL